MTSTKSIKKWEEQANRLAEIEEWTAAVVLLKRAALARPHETARWRLIAEWQLRDGDVKAAVATLEDALRLNTGGPPAELMPLWLALAEAQLSAQSWELGAQACGEILRLDSRHHAALELLATAYLQLNDLESAVSVIEKLLALSPRDPLHRLKLATLLQLQGKLGEASREFQRVLELYPGMPFTTDAAEAVEALDHLQTQQILMMASEQNAFRLHLERHFDLALAEGGFYLSDNGRESLRHMVSDVNYETPVPPQRVH